MATSKPGPIREYVETGAEPEFYIMETQYEAVGDGNVRRKAYVLRGNEFHLVHTEIIPVKALILMGQRAWRLGEDVFNQQQFEGLDGPAH